MIYIQSQIEGMPEKASEPEPKKPEPFGGGIPFPGKNVSAWGFGRSNINAVIDGIPAADVEPVRHGNWNIRLADERTLCLECSICGRKVDNIDLHYLLEAGEYGEACRRYPYCHCGAKMDLEELK